MPSRFGAVPSGACEFSVFQYYFGDLGLDRPKSRIGPQWDLTTPSARQCYTGQLIASCCVGTVIGAAGALALVKAVFDLT